MCTLVVSFAPAEPVPVLLLAVRDELAGRPWRPPGRHWPGLPLIGGIDDLAGGTWLAVHPTVPRAACLLNGRGRPADPGRRRSRGELPLRAAAEGPGLLRKLAADPGALAAYDPFHLICATREAVTQLTWPGCAGGAADRAPRRPAVRGLGPGTHLLTNAGHAYPADPAFPADPVADPKAVHFGARFAAARPPGGPALPLRAAWGRWLDLAAGDGLERADPRAIIAGRVLPGGQVWGSSSVTLLGLAPGAVRYDFQPRPGSAGGWQSVPVG